MIFLSAGHYPARPGACFEDFCEHGEAVKWVNEIAGLIDTNCMIVPTGNLKKKVGYINECEDTGAASICVEIHFNSAMKNSKHIGEGSECLYMPDSQRGAYLADEIRNAIVSDSRIKDRGIKEGWYRMNRLNGPDFFLSKTKYPAVIIEPEFIQHSARIVNSRSVICERIAEALIKTHNDFRS